MKEGIFCPGRLGLELKGSVETFKEIVKEWTERDEECGDIEALLRCGGENWLLNTLVTDTDEGILPSSVEDRRHRFGSNKKEKPPLVKWWRLFIDALGDTTLLILIGCSVISIIVNLIFAPSEEKAFAWVEGLAILIAVLVCALVASTNDHQKAKKFQELYDIEHKKKEVEVIRAKKRISLHPEEIVVGDLIILRGGMEIQGDGILIQGNSIEIDESSMTGESEPQRKDILRRCMIEKEKSMKSVASPVLLAGTKALSGEGKYLVINVGKNSSMGSINSLVESKDDSNMPVTQRRLCKRNLRRLLTESVKQVLCSQS
jgi:magnesium-transporting ATPase (P-type)